MKIWVCEIAEKLKNKGFRSSDYDSEKVEPWIIEFLNDQKFFDRLYDEMVILEEQDRGAPKTYADYLEKIGEV